MRRLLCARSRCRKPAKRYTATTPAVIQHEVGTIDHVLYRGMEVQVCGGGGLTAIVDFCDRHAFRCRWRLEPPPPGAP